MTKTETATHKPEHLKDLAALARMVTYARNTAQSLDAEIPTHCLDIALAAILEQIVETGADLGETMAAQDDSVGAELH